MPWLLQIESHQIDAAGEFRNRGRYGERERPELHFIGHLRRLRSLTLPVQHQFAGRIRCSGR
jgi:hypothetical protein